MAAAIFTVTFLIILFKWAQATNRYWLYDRSIRNWTEMEHNGTVSKNIWNHDHPIKVVIHGFNGNNLPIMELLDAHFITILAKEYAKYDRNLNIIAVDWSKLASNKKYEASVKNVKPAGDQIAEYFVSLLKSGAIDNLKHVHFLGLSMGAHVSAAMGYTIERLTNGDKIGRITGLDPAGPLFTTSSGNKPTEMSNVLDYEDADFVDIIHTNMGKPNGVTLKGRLGSMFEGGHIDFYPNGGELQTDQCEFMMDRRDFCSHQVAVLFYAFSLRRPKKFIGCPCDNYIRYLKGHCECDYPNSGQPIGDLTRPAIRGRYYLTINDHLTPDTFKQ